MNQARSYTSGRSLTDTLREFRELRHSYRMASRRVPADIAKAIDDCRMAQSAYEEATGRPLRGRECLEVGAGQVLVRAAFFAQHNRVTASDLEEYVHGLDLRGYWSMLRANGPKRVVKAIGRKMLGMDRRSMKEMRRQLGTPAPSTPEFVRCDATKTPFAEGRFDLIYSFNVFEHLPDPGAVWRECRRILKPGGVLFTHLHLYTSDSGGHDLRVIRGEREGVPYWGHLRPAHAAAVRNSAYLNRLTLEQWHAVMDAELPGARVTYLRDDDLRPEMARLRAAGELAGYADDALLIRNIVSAWRKPV
jgi:SAM-dependent methyltransferase